MAPTNRIAICPGTYDPVTNGHLDVIARAAKMFDEVIVAVVNRPPRKSSTLFDAEERQTFIRRATDHLANVRVEKFSSLIVAYARSQDAMVIVKGMRAISDFEYEMEMSQLNRHIASEVESVYLMSSPRYSFLSSSGIKEMATFGAAVDDLVPPEVARRLKEELGA